MCVWDYSINLAKSYLVESGSEDSDLDTDDTERFNEYLVSHY